MSITARRDLQDKLRGHRSPFAVTLQRSSLSGNYPRSASRQLHPALRGARAIAVVGGEWPLESVGESLTRITSGNTTGKLLIRV